MKSCYMIYDLAGGIAASATVTKPPKPRPGQHKVATIDVVYVAPKWRNHGLGVGVISQVIEDAYQQRIVLRVVLLPEHESDMPYLEKFYRRLRFLYGGDGYWYKLPAPPR